MSYNISTLPTRNLHEHLGHPTARRRAAMAETPTKIACSTIPWEASTESAARSIESRERSWRLILTFATSLFGAINKSSGRAFICQHPRAHHLSEQARKC